MNVLTRKSLSVAATTLAMTVMAIATSNNAANAFLIKRSTAPDATIAPSLAPPTVITFNGLTGSVPDTATPIGPGGLNGGATIARTAGGGPQAEYLSNQLSIRNGTVDFVFNDSRGMGYFGFFLANAADAGETISFFGKNGAIQTFTTSALTGLTGAGNYFNFFVTNNNEIFNRVVFNHNGAGNTTFLIDDVAYQAIPTPALLPGLIAMGIGVLRKRKDETSEEAEA